VLLLDEPFTGLDQRAKKCSRSTCSFRQRGRILMTTHSFGRELAVRRPDRDSRAAPIALDTARGTLSGDDVLGSIACTRRDAP